MKWRSTKRASVEITDREIRMMWYSKGFSKNLTGVTFNTLHLSPGIIEQGMVKKHGELTQLLKKYLESLNLKGKIYAQITLSDPNVFIRQYKLPRVAKGEQKDLFRYLADEEIPIPPNERLYDVLIQAENDEHLQVVLCGIRKDVVSDITICFEMAGFIITSLGFSTLAWASALGLKENMYTLLINQLSDNYQFVIYQGYVPKLIRSCPGLMAGDKLSVTFEEEIKRIINYWSLQDSGIIERVIVGAGKEFYEIGRFVNHYLVGKQGTEPKLENMNEVIFSLEDLQEPHRYLATIGTALQKESSSNNFLRGKVTSEKRFQKQRTAVGIILVLSLLGMGVNLHFQHELTRLQSEVDSLNIDIDQLRANESLETEKLGKWMALKKNKSLISDHIAILQRQRVDGLVFQRFKYQYGEILIEGVATEAIAVQNLFNNLKLLGYKNPSLQRYNFEYEITPNNELQQTIRFSLTVQCSEYINNERRESSWT